MNSAKTIWRNTLTAMFVLIVSSGYGQFTDSNLPIVLINTNGSSIPDQPRIVAQMKIIYNGPGQRNFLTDENTDAKLNYNGKILIETRGSSSQTLPKKQYGLTTVMSDNSTANNVSLLEMPAENDWVLNGLAFDPSLIRDYLGYNLSRQIGNYAPRQRYCEVLINGVYKGLYLLQEKIKADKNRVDIAKIDPTDNILPDLSGGYIVKADKITGEDPSSWTMPTYLNTTTDFVNEFPGAQTVTPAQKAYIKSVFDKLALVSNNASSSGGFPSVIDVPSFIDFMLVNELAANVDAYQFSTFFHKDKNGKLRAGPLWDLNLTFGNDLYFWGLDRSKTFTWQFDNGDNIGPKFWKDLFDNSTYKCYLSKRFNELTSNGQALSSASINAFIDATVGEISEAVERENATWNTVGDHGANISVIKSFVNTRITWMKDHLGGYSGCSTIAQPPLVISKINYHPAATPDFQDESDLEFIEITNTSASSLDVTGIYFSGTGFVYSFGNGAVLPANAVIQLANNRIAFEKQYGYIPYGEFTRSLSNSGQRLTLADAFGNAIDVVEYSDTTPWPGADGDGNYLKLEDLSADNNVGANWTTSAESIASTVVITGTKDSESIAINLYPNPTFSDLNVKSAEVVKRVIMYDSRGVMRLNQTVQTSTFTLNLSDYSSGVYFLSIQTGEKTSVLKIVKL